MNSIVKQQIAFLQQAVLDLQKTKENIQQAIGASDLGKRYLKEASELIAELEDDIINLQLSAE